MEMEIYRIVMLFELGFMESYSNIILPYGVFDLVFSEMLSFVYKKLFESQPEDGFMKKPKHAAVMIV